MSEFLLELRNIVKEFSGVKALNGVTLTVKPGEVVSLCGENGSGKSTLMKVVSGVWPHGSYSGEIIFDGRHLEAKGIRDSEAVGIAIIHQELALVKEMTVLENIFLGNEITHWGRLNTEAMFKRTQELLKRVQLDINPDTPLKELGVGQQQLVEIAKALNKNARLLILDEPTSSLTEREIELLLEIVRQLRREGISCVYISHKLNEVLALSDRVTVIRDGELIGTCDADSLTQNDIIQMMVGRELDQLFPREAHPIGDVILEVNRAYACKPGASRPQVDDISFNLRKGEILGIAGLVGSGRTELMQCLFGCYEGESRVDITLHGRKLNITNSREALGAGIAMVPEDRKRHGIVPIMSVGRNMTLSKLDFYSRWVSGVNEQAEYVDVLDYIRRLTVKTASTELAIKNLSGGNQQKVILAKLLMTEPEVLILDEPTRGIDVGAKYEIYKLMYELVNQGMSIIMVSSELPEVLGISDRVLVMHEGRLKGEFDHRGLTQEMIMDCAIAEEIRSHD
ncbi:xylose ABC transporter ATP-binding protein [Marinobacterium sp. D7]|uniref:xylose ABC transporter ATP-binding protein n=1 Tax=Marinobacterium ramblicola TaxID=2849041 RepID=UPI001C2CD9E1|nr:xylose ABC transporter ATP-binding protein [Marinobacterium ramblicola]MBV1787636.1 xylose ABC transporter ATP-binding protein [Marinobacterium ramblicola]